MRYFRNSKSEFFGIDVGQESIIQPDWVEVTKSDIDAANAPTEEQKRARRIYELKDMLAKTDYKVLPDYDKPDAAIKVQRQAWRDEIRKLGG